MLKNLPFILPIFLFLISCNSSELDYNVPYAGDKIVVNGFVDNDNGCVIAISKTGPASGKFEYDRNEVKEAKVFLFENGTQILELQRDSTKKFVSTNFSPKEGSQYKIKATSMGLPDVESEEVLFTDLTRISDVRTEIKKDIVFGRKGVVFTFKFEFDTSKINYYTLEKFGDKDNVDGRSITIANNTATCEAFSIYFDSFFSTKCLKSGQEMQFALEPYNPKTRGIPSVLRLKISSIPKAYFEYREYTNQTYTSLDAAFLEPIYVTSNIKNGYGNFYKKCSITLTYKL